MFYVMDLTREEFISVWKNESDLKIKMSEKKHATPRTSNMDIKQIPQRQGTADEGSSVDSPKHQAEMDWHRLQSQLEENLHIKFEHLSKKLIEKQERLSQQNHVRLDQLLGEFRSRCEILFGHITKTADDQANSLKLYIMQEIDLLKQDLNRFSIKQSNSCDVGLSNSYVPLEQVAQKNFASDFTPNVKCLQVNNINGQINTNNEAMRSYNQQAQQFVYQNAQKFQHNEEISYVANESCGNNEDGGIAYGGEREEEKKWTSKKYQKLLGKSYAKAASSAACSEISPFSLTGPSLPSLLSDKLTNFASNTALQVMPSKSSVAATGLYAELIANQMKSKPSSQASSVASSKTTKKTNPVNAKPNEKPLDVKPITNPENFKFIIKKSDKLKISQEILWSNPVFSNGKECKAQLGVKVETSGHLIIYVLVSKGTFDNNHKWPLQLTGSGSIYNINSKSYTPLWHIGSVSCPKPVLYEDEWIFPASVCLTTNTKKLPNVTYKVLEERKYVFNDRLQFQWGLTATEL